MNLMSMSPSGYLSSLHAAILQLPVSIDHPGPMTELSVFKVERDIREARKSSRTLLLLGDFKAKNSSLYRGDDMDPLGERLQCLFSSYNLPSSRKLSNSRL